jgi:hypothetical protein
MPASSHQDRTPDTLPHYRDTEVSWWQYPCEGGLVIIIEVGRPSVRRGEGHQPLRTFIEPDDTGSDIEKKADELKELGHIDFRELVEAGKVRRLV